MSGWIKASQQLQHSLNIYCSQNKGMGREKKDSHPQFEVRKTDLEAIEQFRWWWENV